MLDQTTHSEGIYTMSDYGNLVDKFTTDFYFDHRTSSFESKSTFHIHQDFEVFYTLSDQIMFEVNDQKRIVQKDSLILLSNADLHHMYPLDKSDFKRYIIYFKPEYIQSLSSPDTNLLQCFYFRPFEDAHILQLTEEQKAKLIPLYDKLEALVNTKQPEFGHDLELKFVLGEILILINRFYKEKHNISNELDDKYSLVYNIIYYLLQNFSEDISLASLSEKFYINKAYLSTLFKEVTGSSPIQYLINFRLSKAKEYLASSYSIEEVCSMVGYNSLPHFSRAFKAYTGLSPKRYQQQLAEKSEE